MRWNKEKYLPICRAIWNGCENMRRGIKANCRGKWKKNFPNEKINFSCQKDENIGKMNDDLFINKDIGSRAVKLGCI